MKLSKTGKILSSSFSATFSQGSSEFETDNKQARPYNISYLHASVLVYNFNSMFFRFLNKLAANQLFYGNKEQPDNKVQTVLLMGELIKTIF